MRGRRFAAVAAGVAVFVVVTTGRADAAACPALDYRAGLATAAAALQRAPVDVVGALADVVSLVGADPASDVALQPVLDDLSTAPARVDDARLRLTAMSATLAYPSGSVCNENAGAARGVLHNVYASPAFSHLDDTVKPGILNRILSFLLDLFGRAAGALGVFGGAGLAALVLGLALFLAWRRWHGSAALRGAASEEPRGDGDDPEAEWESAQRAAAAGAYREAVRRAFRSALLEVAMQGRVHIDPAWTTRELLERCRAEGDVLAALATAAAIFDRAWYGRLTVTADDWARAEDRCAAVRHIARRTGVRAR